MLRQSKAFRSGPDLLNVTRGQRSSRFADAAAPADRAQTEMTAEVQTSLNEIPLLQVIPKQGEKICQVARLDSVY